MKLDNQLQDYCQFLESNFSVSPVRNAKIQAANL